MRRREFITLLGGAAAGSSSAERGTDRKAFLLHFAQEEAVKRKTFRLIALLASVIAAGLPTTGLFATKGAAQSPQTQARGVPVVEVDPTWPRLPPQFKLGDASTFALDAP